MGIMDGVRCKNSKRYQVIDCASGQISKTRDTLRRIKRSKERKGQEHHVNSLTIASIALRALRIELNGIRVIQVTDTEVSHDSSDRIDDN